MKNRLVSYAVVGLTSFAITALPIAARAADGALTLAVAPSRMEVNGQAFQPGDGLVFVADGVAYAPVRELAEAFGIEADYDPTRNLISVYSSSVTASEDFTTQWTVHQKPLTNYGDEKIFTATYSGPLSMGEFKGWWKALGMDAVQTGAEQLAGEAQNVVGGKVTMYFDFHGYALGTAYARGGYETSNFDTASAWIK